MKKIKISTLILFTTFIYACNDQHSYESPMIDLTAVEEMDDGGYDPNKKVIKRGNVSFETSDFTKTKSFIVGKLKVYGGEISSENIGNYSSREEHSLTTRIPSANFDKFIDDLEQEAKVFSRKNIYAEDVTSEFIDVEARLKTKKALEERYLELLNKAAGVREILEIESHAASLRGEIESMEQRLSYLENQVAFSTLEINYYKESPKRLMLGKKLQTGVKNGWNNLMLFFVGLVNVWPFVLLIGILVWYFYRKRRRS